MTGPRKRTCSCGRPMVIIATLDDDWWACERCDLLPMDTTPKETP